MELGVLGIGGLEKGVGGLGLVGEFMRCIITNLMQEALNLAMCAYSSTDTINFPK